MDDDDAFGVEYVIDTAQQFWSELEEILNPPVDATLQYLDSRLRTFVKFCSTYHDRYLSTPAQLEYSCQLLLESDFFTFHSSRSCALLIADSTQITDPHVLFILYTIFLARGRQHLSFFRSNEIWQPMLPLLMDHVIFESQALKPEDDTIEGRLRYLAIELLFQLCRLQKLSSGQLGVFSDQFLDDLFDLVENSRENDMLGYSVIRFLVCLNEQFMVASVADNSRKDSTSHHKKHARPDHTPSSNRVLSVLMLRLHQSKTFGENLIFMLNRADDTPEDQALQLLILKMLYLLFTTSGTQEYFYTNDLRVLVDVFMRELNNISDDNESLRHTYLRVLFPLLTNTQLKDSPYKPVQVHNTLQNVISHSHIRDIDPTTRRLVERCMSGDWCKGIETKLSPSASLTSIMGHADVEAKPSSQVPEATNGTASTSASASNSMVRQRSLQRSASAEMLRKARDRERDRKASGDEKPTSSAASASASSSHHHKHHHHHRPSKEENDLAPPGQSGSLAPRAGGPRPFTPLGLSRQSSVKARRGEGLTAHIASLTIVPRSESVGSVAAPDGEPDLAGRVLPASEATSPVGGGLTAADPRADALLMSPMPMQHPMSPVTSSEEEGEGGRRGAGAEVDDATTPTVHQPRPMYRHDHTLHPHPPVPGHRAPQRSKSADPTTAAFEASGHPSSSALSNGYEAHTVEVPEVSYAEPEAYDSSSQYASYAQPPIVPSLSLSPAPSPPPHQSHASSMHIHHPHPHPTSHSPPPPTLNSYADLSSSRIASPTPPSPASSYTSSASTSALPSGSGSRPPALTRTRTKSPPPPPPVRRRKPPAPPPSSSSAARPVLVSSTSAERGETMHTIASSTVVGRPRTDSGSSVGSVGSFGGGAAPARPSPLNPSTLASLRAKKARGGTLGGARE